MANTARNNATANVENVEEVKTVETNVEEQVEETVEQQSNKLVLTGAYVSLFTIGEDEDTRKLITIGFQQSFDGVHVNKETGEYEQAKVKSISLPLSQFVRQIAVVDNRISALYSRLKDNDNLQTALNTVISNSKITLSRELHNVGDIYIDNDGAEQAYESMGYKTTIDNIVITKKVINDLLDGEYARSFGL